MLTEERYNYILNQLKTSGIVKIQELMKDMNTSESTLRRDLQELENQHLLQRIHGGAKKLSTVNEETTIKHRSAINQSQKISIAKRAVEYIHDGDVIFLDSGTSTKEIVPFLTNFNNLLVVTNSIDNAEILADFQIKTYLPGGVLKNSTKALVGASLIQNLEHYSFDTAFLGTNGFDLKAGYTTPDPEEAAVKNLAITRSKQVFVLADETKCNEIAFCQFAKMQEATLITNHLSEELAKQTQLNILEVKE